LPKGRRLPLGASAPLEDVSSEPFEGSVEPFVIGASAVAGRS
jgi:hypothetical protein